MKTIKIRNLALLAISTILVATSCKKSDFAINTNPDDVTASTVDYISVLPAAQSYTASITASQWRFLQHWMGYWARSGSYQSEQTTESYQFTNDYQSGIWNNYYYNANNYNFVITNAHAKGAGTYEAIGRIMKAMDFQVLVDVYGNIPYFEAFYGTTYKTPKYTDDLDIYKDLLRQLDTAIVLLKDPDLSSTSVNPLIGANDLVFGGNTTMWIKAANTLKLKLLIHCSTTKFVNDTEMNSYVSGIDVAAEAAAIVAEGSGFLGRGESIKINPGYSGTKPNPFYRTYRFDEKGNTASSGDISKANIYAVGTNNDGYYQYDGDPRVNKFYVLPSGATKHRGITFGEISGVDPNNVGNKLSSVYGTGLIPNGATTDAWILTSVESMFLQAEAVYRGLIPGDSETALGDAVRESFTWLGLTDAQADAYITGNAGYADVDINAAALSPTQAAGGMYTILSQKWFALNSIATLEVWTDYRRSDIAYGAAVDFDPGPPISILAGASPKIPTRLFYPQAEYNYNAANVGAEGVLDLFNPSARNRIFWDLN